MDSTQIGLAGEFYVLAQLVQRGLMASLTLANAKGVDILVANAKPGARLQGCSALAEEFVELRVHLRREILAVILCR